jgi:hypothetical protein
LDILTMHGPINVKSPNNISNWQMRFNSAFKGLKYGAFGHAPRTFGELLFEYTVNSQLSSLLQGKDCIRLCTIHFYQ